MATAATAAWQTRHGMTRSVALRRVSTVDGDVGSRRRSAPQPPGLDWHHQVECEDCHVVPTELLTPGHIDTDLPAELTWSVLALSDGAVPAFDGTRCGGAYCHGATLFDGGGSNTSPTWTRVDGTEAACGACHDLPPGGDHPPLAQCEMCHGEVVGPGFTFVAPELHIDGIVESTGGDCESCHGGGGSPAPPLDTAGGSPTTLRGGRRAPSIRVEVALTWPALRPPWQPMPAAPGLSILRRRRI